MPTRQTFVRKLSNLDIFGRDITLAYKKNFKNKTITGAIFTILLLIMVGTYSINGVTKVFLNTTVHVVAEEQFSSEHQIEKSLTLDDFLFKFGFGFQTSGYFPKEYGELSVELLTRTRSIGENGQFQTE